MEPDVLHGIDPAEVSSTRAGNSLWPGLLAFTGVSFAVYLAVKGASGTVPMDTALFAQLAVSAAMTVIGVVLLLRARYFYVVVEAATGTRRIGGLSKAEQTVLLERIEAARRED